MGWSDSFLAVELVELLGSEDYCKAILKSANQSKEFKKRFGVSLVLTAESIVNLLKQIKGKRILELDDNVCTYLKFFLLDFTAFSHWRSKVISIEDGSEEHYMLSVVTSLLEDVSKEATKLWTELVKPNTEKKCEHAVIYGRGSELKFTIKNVKQKEYNSYNIGFLCSEEVKILRDAFAEIIRDKSKFEQIGKNTAREINLEYEDFFLEYYYRRLYIERLFLMIDLPYGKPLLIFKRF